MKRPVLANRKDVVSAVICAFPGGRPYAAAELGMPVKKFDNQAYESAGSRPLSDDHIHRLEQIAGTAFLPSYIAAMYGGIFVPLTAAADLDNVELYNRSVKAAAKRGKVDQIIGPGDYHGLDELHVRSLRRGAGHDPATRPGGCQVSTYKLVCPHCFGRMRIRTSEGTHIFLRVAYLQCTNEACGWSVRAQFEMTHEMSPSGMANPAVRLPVADIALRRAAMRTANDQPDLLDQMEMECTQ
jgi:hypothetical protein